MRHLLRTAGSKINLDERRIICQNQKVFRYKKIISTLPLFQIIQMCGLKTKTVPDPYTSVLVLNIGAETGKRFPGDHWVYIPKSESGFHRVGIYSNVDTAFLPKKHRKNQSAVGLYVERSFPGGAKPTDQEIKEYSQSVLRELRDWGYIKECHVMDPTWIETAYTWAWPDSKWKAEAMRLLEAHQIYPVGRYARWVFQGIADSIRDGLIAGSSFKHSLRR
jgi:protoporphyrinogen oxidase